MVSLFSDDQLRRIREAVQAAERGTRGEIVPMIVPASARYREAEHRAGLMAALLALAGMLATHAGGMWLGTHPAWILAGTAAAYVVGALAGRRPSLVRLLVSDQRMAFKVRHRALAAFHEHGLHRTREGTGILIFISLLEHRVEIVADRAINARVPPETWQQIVDRLVEGLRAGRAVESVCEAITACGDWLARYFPAGERNPNELPDDLKQS